MSRKKVRAVAFYLPQFHAIPENDRWWGKGFTEWTNVKPALPRFPGHYQPHLPGELGYYDLTDPAIRAVQASLARQYGVAGFCYYHYWFTGKRLLEQPFKGVIESGEPDFPFCLCWANENWTRRWDGADQEILQKQEYGAADDLAHIRWLLKAFSDKRYITVDGKPLFIVYRPFDLPDPNRTTDLWRREAEKAGFPGLYLCRIEVFRELDTSPEKLGFDAAIEFQPDARCRGAVLGETLPARLLRYYKELRHRPLDYIYDYNELVLHALKRRRPPYKRYRCVTPGWDNSPRRKVGARMFAGSTPERYEFWLESVGALFEPFSPEENFIFINAWNEWAEGNHLEPCQRWGRGYLEATLRALEHAGLSRTVSEFPSNSV